MLNKILALLCLSFFVADAAHASTMASASTDSIVMSDDSHDDGHDDEHKDEHKGDASH